MKIVVLGAGQVGSSVAHSLSNEENDITIVDTDATRLKILQDRLDIRGVLGHASHPKVLVRAGIEDADLVIALTNSDEAWVTEAAAAQQEARLRSAGRSQPTDLWISTARFQANARR